MAARFDRPISEQRAKLRASTITHSRRNVVGVALCQWSVVRREIRPAGVGGRCPADGADKGRPAVNGAGAGAASGTYSLDSLRRLPQLVRAVFKQSAPLSVGAPPLAALFSGQYLMVCASGPLSPQMGHV